MVSQCFENQGNIIRTKDNINKNISYKDKRSFFWFFIFLKIIVIRGKMKNIMLVGFIRNIRPKDIPDRIESK